MPTLLDLPPHVRHRIYAAADILGSTHRYPRFINLNNDGAPDHNHGRESFLVTHALLLSCQTIYAEVSSDVYANNFFFLRFNDTNSLGALRRLLPTSVQVLKRLTIHLNVAACGLGSMCDREIDPWSMPDSDKVDEPLRLPKKAAQEAIYEWHHTWNEQIRPNLVNPVKLELNFICDVADLETAKLVVQPFLAESQPTLSKLNIRLSDRKESELQHLAERAVSATTGYRFRTIADRTEHATAQPFRFLDLPTELRQRIFQYTDLVLRWREVEWNAVHGYYSRSRMLGFDTCYPQTRHGTRDYSGRDESWPEDISCFACWEKSHEGGCFCMTYHTTASSYRSCKCWAPPTPLFLVCRLMRQHALQVFFSQNRLIVVPDGGGYRLKTATTSPTRLPISIFLTERLPQDAFQYLRFLEIVFPAFGENSPVTYCPRGSPEWYDWINTLKLIKDKLSLSKLTIRVYFATWEDLRLSNVPPYRQHMNEAQRQAIKACYANTIAPLRLLKGMNRFFAYLANPPQPNVGEYDYIEEWAQQVEKTVMGDGCDSTVAGKADVACSRWLLDHGQYTDRTQSEADYSYVFEAL